MTGFSGFLPLSVAGAVTPIDDMRARREQRNRWRRVPRGNPDAAAASTDHLPPVTLIRRTDADVARMTALMERLAGIGRVPDVDDLRDAADAWPEGDPPPYIRSPEPDLFAEGALLMLRYLRGEMDEVSFMANWITETGVTP